jgi:hypothetical protein
VDSLAQLRPLVKGSRVRLFNAGVSGAS